MDKITTSRNGRKELAGQIFGLLSVQSFAFTKKQRAYWNCLCDCGKSCIVVSKSLLNGDTRSCGCLCGERHGKVQTREYVIWCGMKDRCYRENNQKYHRYGGRGITVCDRWLNSFQNFIEDMCLPPTSKHTIDRIDNDSGYYKDNCRWALQKQQANNRNTCVYVTINGKTKTVTEWCEYLNIVTPKRALTRIKKFGWNPEVAIKTPARKINRSVILRP